MPVALSLFLVLFFLLMNAFFVVAEFSLVRVRKSQVEMAVDEGKAGSKYAKLVADNVNAYLSACRWPWAGWANRRFPRSSIRRLPPWGCLTRPFPPLRWPSASSSSRPCTSW